MQIRSPTQGQQRLHLNGIETTFNCTTVNLPPSEHWLDRWCAFLKTTCRHSSNGRSRKRFLIRSGWSNVCLHTRRWWVSTKAGFASNLTSRKQKIKLLWKNLRNLHRFTTRLQLWLSVRFAEKEANVKTANNLTQLYQWKRFASAILVTRNRKGWVCLSVMITFTRIRFCYSLSPLPALVEGQLCSEHFRICVQGRLSVEFGRGRKFKWNRGPNIV